MGFPSNLRVLYQGIRRVSKQEIRTPLRFVVTVDTEADDAWAKPGQIHLDNVRELPRFQDLCEQYDVVPTYLLTYECAARDEALSVLKPLADARRCEIGHHLHVWTTPPFQGGGRDGVDHDWLQAFQFQLPDSLFLEKAECLRETIEAGFGRSPTAHRAGRWGIDQRTVDWLASAGFVVETSLRPDIRLTMQRPGVKLSAPPGEIPACMQLCPQRNPYCWSARAARGNGGSVVEIPSTVDTPEGILARVCRHGFSSAWPGQSVLGKIYWRLGGFRMLRPDPAYHSEYLPGMIERSIRQGITVINLMLHSSELALDCSPFTRTKQGLESIWMHLEKAFRHVRKLGIESDGISNVGRLVQEHAQRP